MISAALSAAIWISVRRQGTKATTMPRTTTPALTIVCSQPRSAWPQMLNGLSRSSWLFTVRSQNCERPGSTAG